MRILSVADIHLHDYPKHNLENDSKFRLNQFDRLADRMINIFVAQKCTDIAIAGDLIQTPTIKPHIQHALFSFARKLDDAVRQVGGQVYFTVGNHDKESRLQDSDPTASIVTLLSELDNWTYMDRKVIEVPKYGVGRPETFTIGFQDYYGEHDLKWMDELGHEKVDLLFNHFTMAGEFYGGQTIDSTKYGLMAFGDIHTAFERGNNVSIGNPIGHRLGDQQDGTVMIIDTNESAELVETPCSQSVQRRWGVAFKWVDVIVPGEFEFLRMYRAGDKNIKNPGSMKYDVEMPRLERGPQDNPAEINNKSLDWKSLLKEELESEGLMDIHQQIYDEAQKSDMLSEPLDLNFTMIRTTIQNFRSIDFIEFDWKPGTTLFNGPRGAGKTTVVQAMIFALFGDRSVKDQLRNTAPKGASLMAEQVLEYDGLYHRVERGWNGKGYLKYWVGSEEEIMVRSYLPTEDEGHFPAIKGNKIADIDGQIRSRLKFMDMWRLIYVDQNSTGILSGMSEGERVEMLAKLLGWEDILSFKDLAQKASSFTLSEYNSKESESKVIGGKIDIIRSLGLVMDERDYDSEIKSEGEGRLKLVSSNQSYLNSIAAAAKLEAAREEVVAKATSLSEIKECGDLDRSLLMGQMSGFEARSKELVATRSVLDSIPAKEEAIKRLQTQIQETAMSIGQLSGPSCPTCNQKVHDQTAMDKAKSDKQAHMTKLAGQVATANTDLDTQRKKVSDAGVESKGDLIDRQGKLAVKMTDCQNDLYRIDNFERKQRELESAKSKVNSLLDAQSQSSTEEVPDKQQYESNSLAISAIDTRLGELSQMKTTASKNNETLAEMSKLEMDLGLIVVEMEELSEKRERYLTYIELTSIGGKVIGGVLTMVSEMLSNDLIRVRTIRALSNGELRPDLTLMMKVGEHWIEYRLLSGGQKSTADMYFLLSLVDVAGGLGMMILDEVFKFLDNESEDEFGGKLASSNIRQRIVISHSPSFVYKNLNYRVNLSEAGISHYKLV